MEIELKYILPDAEAGFRILEELAPDKKGDFERAHMKSEYFDTADELLGSQSISMRMRNQNGVSYFNVKAKVSDQNDLALRDEWEYEAENIYDGLKNLPDTGIDSLARIARGEIQIIPIAEFEFDRVYIETDLGDGCVAEVCVDYGTMTDGDKIFSFSELEAELKQGYNIDSLMDFGRKLCERHNLQPQPHTKLARALGRHDGGFAYKQGE